MDIITQLFSQIDSVASSAIQTIYQSLATGLLPVFHGRPDHLCRLLGL